LNIDLAGWLRYDLTWQKAGGTMVFRRRNFPVLRSSCSWWM